MQAEKDRKREDTIRFVYVVVVEFSNESGIGFSILASFLDEIEAEKYLLLLNKVDSKRHMNGEYTQEYSIEKVKLN